MKYKLFIIIVSYNGMKWLPECLERTKPYSVIVVDNKSNDGTQNYIRTNHSEIILLEQEENLGFGKANNIGIFYALQRSADFVFLLNQDAFLEAETIQTLIDISIKNPNYGILSPVHLDGTGDKLDKSFLYYLKKNKKSDLLSDFVLNKEKKDIYSFNMINAAAWLLPVKTLNIVGGFHPMFFLYGEDDNYCQRVLYHGLEIGVVPSTSIVHDSNNNNLNLPNEGSDKYFEKFLNIIKVRYANVNTNDFENIKRLKWSYVKFSLKALFKFDIKSFQINLRKSKLLGKMDLSKDVEEGRRRRRNYLDLKD